MSSTTVVLGGGFGGLAAANALRTLVPSEHAIVVVDRADRFHVGAGKTWIMLGERTHEAISAPRSRLLLPGIRLVEAPAASLSIADRSVMAGSERLTWDFLVIALGADLDLGVVPGLAEAAESFYTVEGAERLRRKLEAFPGGDVVVLIPKIPFKCPPAPYEAAMLLEEAFRRRGAAARLAIHTVEPAPMGTAGPEMGAFIKAELARRDIAYFPQRVTGRVDASEGRIVFQDGGEARYDLLIAIPPHVAPQVVREAGLTGPAGWIPVDPRTLEVAGHPNVHAVGDVAAVPLPGRFKPEMPLSLPKAGVFAHAQGRVAAHRIAARILGTAAEETFDGKGYCFLETGGGRAVKAEGSFFDLPHPAMEKREPDPTQLREKHAWVDGLLRTPA